MKLKLSGKTDLVLSETKAALMEFSPGNAPAEQKEVETIAGILLLGTRSTVQETAGKIEDYFDSARRAQKDLTLPKIYLEADTGDGYVRSEILDGVLDTETDYFHRVARNHVPARIWVKRKNYWEGAEAQIPLTNENGTNNVAGLKVYNTNNGTGTAPNKRVNYVGIDGDDIDGSIPTPPRIEITNTYSSGTLCPSPKPLASPTGWLPVASALAPASTTARALPAGIAMVAAMIDLTRPAALAVGQSGLRAGLLLEGFAASDPDPGANQGRDAAT